MSVYLADAPVSPVANRAARWIPLIGFLEWSVWIGIGATLFIESAISSALSQDARLSLWSLGHLVVGAAAVALCACPECLVTGFFLIAGAVLAVIDTTELVVRLVDLAGMFPNISVFSFIYAAFNAILLALAAWLTAASFRAGSRYFGFGLAMSRVSGGEPSSAPLFDDDDDDDDNNNTSQSSANNSGVKKTR